MIGIKSHLPAAVPVETQNAKTAIYTLGPPRPAADIANLRLETCLISTYHRQLAIYRMPNYYFTSSCGVGTLLAALTAYVCHKSSSSPPAAMLMCTWVLSINFLSFVDSIIWSSASVETWWDGKIYCDINIRIKNACNVGIPGSAIGPQPVFSEDGKRPTFRY
jgi:hypothetical protein